MSAEITRNQNTDFSVIQPDIAKGLESALDGMKGPVDSFVPRGNKYVIEYAALTGEITPRAFADCSIFDETDAATEQHKLRQEAKRAAEVRHIITESGELPEAALLDIEMAGLFIGQSLARATLVEAAAQYRRAETAGTLSDDVKERLLRQIDISQEILFPLPDKEIAAVAARAILDAAAERNSDKFEALTTKYDFLKHYEDNPIRELLSEEKREEWHALLHGKYDQVFNKIYDEIGEEPIIGDVLLRVTRLFMGAQGIPLKSAQNDGWTIRADDSIKGFRVDPNIREVVVGRRDEPLAQVDFEKLMMHEVVIHVTRGENGYQTGYPAIQNGLPGYGEPEEGLGLLMESLWSGESLNQVSREDYRYLTVCYSDGLLDGKRHDETETFQFASDIMGLNIGENVDKGGDMSLTKAGEHTMRAFRGMPLERRMYSNLAYKPGKIKAAEYLNQSTLPAAETLVWLQRGKTNPFSEAHENIMTRIAVAKQAA